MKIKKASNGIYLPDTLVIERNIAETIDNLIKTFVRNTPKKVINAFVRGISQTRSSISNEKCFTREKSMLRVADIPVSINNVMMMLFGKEWINDKVVSRIFWERIKDWRYNQTTVPGCIEDKTEQLKD